MIYQFVFRRITNPFKRLQDIVKVVYITSQLRLTSEVYLTVEEANYIDSLRGLNGLRAKREAFEIAMSSGNWTYFELCLAFPNYDSTCKQ